MTEPATNPNPFLGARPYGLPQIGMFFGREFATRQLAGIVAVHPIVAITSPSGVGKTSLIRAGVIPALERSGLSCVYLRPDPSTEFTDDGAATLLDGRFASLLIEALMPDPILELGTLRIIEEHLPGATLDEAKDWFSGLEPFSEPRQAILEPSKDAVQRNSMISRYLAGILDREAFVEQWARVDESIRPALGGEAKCSRLIKAFESKPLMNKAQARKRQLCQSSPEPAGTADDSHASIDLGDLPHIARLLLGDKERQPLLVRPDGDLELLPRVVVCIDQFEQIFTVSKQQSRERVITLISDVLAMNLGIHFVLALRKEWYAELTRIFDVTALYGSPRRLETYHLDSMSRDEAAQIMTKAPHSAGSKVAISPASQDMLWNVLQYEGFVDAVTLSIACHEMFDQRKSDEDVAQEDLSEADVTALLTSFVSRALAEFVDQAEFDEAIDLLGEIAGSGTTRQFFTDTSLLAAPLLNKQRRADVLAKLQSGFLIRGDSTRGGTSKLFDIMHEALLEPVRDITKRYPEIHEVRRSAENVARIDSVEKGVDLRDCYKLLNPRALERLTLDSRSAGVLLRSLLRIDIDDEIRRNPEGVDVGENYREDVLTLIDYLASHAALDAPVATSAESRWQSGWWLNEKELDELLHSTNSLDEHESFLVLQTLVRRDPDIRTQRHINEFVDLLAGKAA